MKATNSSSPRRSVALLLGILGLLTGYGMGHFYLGLKRRAAAWWLLAGVCPILLVASLPVLGMGIGYRKAFLVFLFSLLVIWAAPVVDLVRVSPERFRRVPGWHLVFLWFALSAAALVFHSVIRTFLLEAFKTQAGSMIPTLLLNDHFFVDKRAYRKHAPQRGDLVVFSMPQHQTNEMVKRIIARPGDHLEIKKGHPCINGWEVPHCVVGSALMLGNGDSIGKRRGDVEVEFLEGNAYLTVYEERSAVAETEKMQGPFTAARTDYWVLGDNRYNSYDSPAWFGGDGGGVPAALIKGKALFIWMSNSANRMDWSRAGWSLSEPQLPVSMRALQPGLARCLESRPAYENTLPPPAGSRESRLDE